MKLRWPIFLALLCLAACDNGPGPAAQGGTQACAAAYDTAARVIHIFVALCDNR